MRILVVEDEPIIGKNIKRGLEQESYAVDLADNGRQGLDYALGEEYDCIILDRMLPDIDGLEVCQKLRQEYVSTPVILLTALDSVENKIEGLNCGADDYLVKPFAFEELIARIQAVTRRPKTVPQTTLKINDLEIDTTSKNVVRSKRPITLSKTEYSLLEYLAINRDQVLSKDTLIQHVWNYDADVLPNTVEAYIKKLRQKIDKPFPQKPTLIHTVRGFGYKLSLEE